MSRVPAVLALLGGAPLAALTLVETSALVPVWLPVALVGLGTALSVVTAWVRRPRWHAVGVLVTVAGAGLTGATLTWPFLLMGALGIVLVMASLGLAIEMPHGSGHAKLAPVTLLVAAVAAGLGTLAALGLGELAGGGVDARTGATAWVVLVVAVTWALVRRVRGEPQ